MKKRIIAAILLAALSLGLLLLPIGNPYRDPLLWARYAKGGSQPVDVFLVGATADLGKDGTYQSSVYLPRDRHYQSALLRLQEGLYSGVGRIYAPYYRQGCLSIYYLPDAERGPYFAVAYSDVRNAFLRYLQVDNDGRPFILAGYSQGADLALRLMEEFFGDSSIRDRLVAAYLIGWRITYEDLSQFPQLRMAQGESDTGVIVSFNSEAPGVTGSIIVPEGGYTYGINPLNWKTDDTPAAAAENPGSCFLHMDGSISSELPHLTGCYRSDSRGTLILPDVSAADYPPGEPIFCEGCYHNFELQFFYRSVQKNVETRVDAYLASHPAA